jgi:hypothetical protein
MESCDFVGEEKQKCLSIRHTCSCSSFDVDFVVFERKVFLENNF